MSKLAYLPTVNELTDAQISSICLLYRHDFGVVKPEIKKPRDILDAKPGELVMYAYPLNGTPFDRMKLVDHNIRPDVEYTVRGIWLEPWSSDLQLAEFPGAGSMA